MERITYRKTLDVHKNGVQFVLQGFETADNMSRVIEISLMASGDAVDFPLERIVAMMYVTTPGATEPSINKCTIKDNKVVYEVLPIVVEGITTMQLKLIETSPEGATSVLASPKFAVEVTKSGADDESAVQSTTFTALEDAMAKAKATYDERFLRMELTSDCIFKAYYADGSEYETDILKKLFHNGNVLLSESFAHGNTGVRAGEDTDNSMYYSNVSKSESLKAKAIMENSEEILEEVKLHGMYTAFSVDFETGNVEYVSPSFKFRVNLETGELEADGQTYTFNDEVYRIIDDWLAENNIVLSDLENISKTHTEEIEELKETTSTHTEDINTLKERVVPIEKGGTGATTKEDALHNIVGLWNLDKNVDRISFSTNSIYGAKIFYSPPYDKLSLAEYNIPMIHSGNIELRFSLGYRDTAYLDKSTVSISVLRNGVSVWAIGYDDGNGIKTIPLNVNKGDIITIAITGKSQGSIAGIIELLDIHLRANIETPYKYYALRLEGGGDYWISEETEADPTAEELLNALMGGMSYE